MLNGFKTGSWCDLRMVLKTPKNLFTELIVCIGPVTAGAGIIIIINTFVER